MLTVVENKKKAIELVVEHNNLGQSIKIIFLLLEGKSPKEISEMLGVSQPQISRVKKKYIK